MVVVPEPLTRVEGLLLEMSRRSRILPLLHGTLTPMERARALVALRGGGHPRPLWEPPRPVSMTGWNRALGAARAALAELALPREAEALVTERIDELELDIAIVAALGDTRRMRPIVARRYGTAQQTVDGVELARAAKRVLEAPVGPTLEATMPASELAEQMEAAARRVGIALRGVVSRTLTAGAAIGDGCVYVQDRMFTRREARRLVAHEIFGHAIASASARAHASRILEIGVAASFEDQEGTALRMEEGSGTLDAQRLRVLAARVFATDAMHRGADLGEAARRLVDDYGLDASVALAAVERAFRGGGVARDVGYLVGWRRVRAALADGTTSLAELRSGRAAVRALVGLRSLAGLGWLTLEGDTSMPSEHLDAIGLEAEPDATGVALWDAVIRAERQ